MHIWVSVNFITAPAVSKLICELLKLMPGSDYIMDAHHLANYASSCPRFSVLAARVPQIDQGPLLSKMLQFLTCVSEEPQVFAKADLIGK